MSADSICFVDVPLSKVDWSFHHKWPLPASLGLYALIGAFTALALWSTILFTIRLLFTFKRRQGPYFWSLLVVTWSLTFRAIGFLLRYTVPSCPRPITGVIGNLGWVGMVTGFSVVLYSRLGLLLNNQIVLRLILAMIIVNGVCLHVATMTAQFGYASHRSDDPQKRAPWIAVSNVIEPLQGVGFTVQQLVISGTYIGAAWKHLRSSTATHQRMRKLMQSLIAVQALVAVMDVAIIVLECVGYFVLKMIVHSFIYSIKLEIEFVVLNQLVALSQVNSGQAFGGDDDLEANPPPVVPMVVRLSMTGLPEVKENAELVIVPSSPTSISD